MQQQKKSELGQLNFHDIHNILFVLYNGMALIWVVEKAATERGKREKKQSKVDWKMVLLSFLLFQY